MSKRLDVIRLRQLLMRLETNLSRRDIAQDMGLSRKTVDKYSNNIKRSKISVGQLLALSDDELWKTVHTPQPIAPAKEASQLQFLLGQVEYFKNELARPGVTLQLLWKEYRSKEQTGYGYAAFCKQLKKGFQQQKTSYHKRYRPAEVLMIDFAGDKLSYTDRNTGEKVFCVVFVSVLGYSNYTYAEVLPSASLPYLIRALNNNLLYLQGVPKSVLTDNMAQVVTKADRYEPTFTEAANGWANHNGTMLQTARVARPQDKSPVELHVRIVYQRIYAILRNEIFYSLKELNDGVAQKLKEHNHTNFQKRTYSRYDQFVGEELKCLGPLPPQQYKMQKYTQAKVQRNYHIMLGEDRHFYSVPFMYVGKAVQLTYTTEAVEIYHQMARIAIHPREVSAFGYTTTAAHMPEAHQHYAESQGYKGRDFLDMASRIGPCTHDYVEKMLQSRKHEAHAYIGCLGLLRLGNQAAYGPIRLEAACSMGLQLMSQSYKTIETILRNNADKQEPSSEDLSLGSHENLRGPEAF